MSWSIEAWWASGSKRGADAVRILAQGLAKAVLRFLVPAFLKKELAQGGTGFRLVGLQTECLLKTLLRCLLLPIVNEGLGQGLVGRDEIGLLANGLPVA